MIRSMRISCEEFLDLRMRSESKVRGDLMMHILSVKPERMHMF